MPASGSRRAWGWHPLVDEWAARVVADSGVRAGDLVFDIGAGDGALTRHLVAANARVIAVELHPRRAAALRDRFGATGNAHHGTRQDNTRPSGDRVRGRVVPPVTVVQVDALELRLPDRPFRVVASPPYAIASPLLRLLLNPRSRLLSADLVLPKMVVRRYAGGAVRVGRRWDIRQGCGLPRRAFRPPPQTDSAVLQVRRR